MDLFETLAQATKPQNKTFTIFKVAAVSTNTNSFGLYQMVMVSFNGTAFKGCFNSLNVKKEGEQVIGHVTLNDNGEAIRTEFTGGELVEQVKDAPELLVKELFN